MVEPRHVHWMAAKHMLRYVRGTIGYGLRYVSGGDVKLQGYTDFDWAGSAADRKSTSGCCFSLGSCMISMVEQEADISGTHYNRGGVYRSLCGKP
jgi:hypothetical protein